MTRVEAYITNFPSAVDYAAILTARKPDMLAQESTILVALQTIEGLVHGTLAGITGATAPTRASYPFYQAAAKRMYRITTTYTGGTMLDTCMAAEITKWALRGLADAILTQIAYEVFHWSAPAPVGGPTA